MKDTSGFFRWKVRVRLSDETSELAISRLLMRLKGAKCELPHSFQV